jgi:hypothetical protein
MEETMTRAIPTKIIFAALVHCAPEELINYRENPDGSATAIIPSGQKFTFTAQALDNKELALSFESFMEPDELETKSRQAPAAPGTNLETRSAPAGSKPVPKMETKPATSTNKSGPKVETKAGGPGKKPVTRKPEK